MLALLTWLGVRCFWPSPASAYRVDIRPGDLDLAAPAFRMRRTASSVTARLSGRLHVDRG